MNKVYLLLRENRESGPFTIDELIQQQLKSTDLIWVEGKSVAWCYPYELDELKSLVERPALKIVRPENPSMAPVRRNEESRPSAAPLTAAASYQKDEIESKADEIRSRIIEFAQHDSMPYFRPAGAEPSSGAMWTRDEGVHVIHHNRKTYVTLPQLIATGLITVLLASAWYGDWSAIKVKPNMITMASTPAAFNEQEPPPQPQTNRQVAAVDSQLVVQSMPGSEISNTGTTNKNINKPVQTGTAADSSADQLSVTQIPVSVPPVVNIVEPNIAVKEVKKDTTTPAENKEAKKETVASEVKTEKEEPAKPAVVEEEKEEKKKKLGQVIKGIFKKKDKDGE